MSKTIIKVYFNNGCTTLMYNQSTTVEDIIKVVIKGRVSLNELRYMRCFSLRATKFAASDISSSTQLHSKNPLATSLSTADVSATTAEDENLKAARIVESFWLRGKLTIQEYLDLIDPSNNHSHNNANDHWKLQLRIRCLPSDLNEVKFKDPMTFNYYYEQIKNDFLYHVAPELTNEPDNVAILLELGCLEMRRLFQNMNPVVLDKKINFEYLEKDVGLRRFFPELVLKQKSKNIKKMIIKNLKTYENLNELECMSKYLEKLHTIWKYDEEMYKCHLGNAWGLPVHVMISYNMGITCKMLNSNDIFKCTDFYNIEEIITEFENENRPDTLLKLKVTETKELLVFKFGSVKEAENMALLVDGYCSLYKSVQSIWLKELEYQKTFDRRKIHFSKTTLPGAEQHTESKKITTEMIKNSNSVQILNEHEQMFRTGMTTGSDVDLDKFEKISLDSIVFHEKLGSGQFGDVFRGTYQKNSNKAIEVAIKRLKTGESNDEFNSNEHDLITKRFICEAKIMQAFDHAHIIKLIGVLVSKTFGIVMELAKFGQLRTYLQNNRELVDMDTLLMYSCQLSSAMDYLESKNYVHRDIAARNVLVVNHECVKLSDFGLSKEIDDIYLASKCKMPIKWMAPESINFGKYSSKSDVWMFAICLWEIFSYGTKPFAGIKNADVKKLIEEKYRLEKPSVCPSDVYSLMLKCWEYDSSLRPYFQELNRSINSIYNLCKEDKKLKISKSLSTGSSSFQSSNASAESSTQSSSNNLTELSAMVTVMRMMPLSIPKKTPEQLAGLNDSASVAAAGSQPPAKPTRLLKMPCRNFEFDRKDNFKTSSSSSPVSHVCKMPPGLPITIEADLNNSNNNFKNQAIVINKHSRDRSIDEQTGRLKLSSKVANKWTCEYDLDNYDEAAADEHAVTDADYDQQFVSQYSTITSSTTGKSNKKQIMQFNMKREHHKYNNHKQQKPQLKHQDSQLDDYKWLDDKLETIAVKNTNKESKEGGGVDGAHRQSSSSSNSSESSSSTSSNSFQNVQSPGSTGPLTRRDLFLRDQTLKLIQNISTFIKHLNQKDTLNLEIELNGIINSLSYLNESYSLIEKSLRSVSEREALTSHMMRLDNHLEQLIDEFKTDNVERVVNLGLELARNANELFLNVTKLKT